jgi:hypothetical protein
VTGRRAFDGESAASVSGAILKDTPPTISRIQPPTPPALDQNAGQIPLEAAGLGTAFSAHRHVYLAGVSSRRFTLLRLSSRLPIA